MAMEALIIAAIGLPLVMGPPFALAALVLIAARTGWESGHVNALRAGTPRIEISYFRIQSSVLCVAAVLGSWMLASRWSNPIAVVTILLLLMGLAVLARPARLPLLQVLILPALPLAALAALISEPRWYPALIVAFLFVETFDSFALLGGRFLGQRPLFPSISPLKTLEGLLSGLMGLAIVASVLNLLSFHLDWLRFALLLGVCSLVAVLGDLAASIPKRSAGVKDYPPLHPAQGGLLDITDSWLVAGPTFCVAVWVGGMMS
jgi:CDP-diglyceride synthetase